MKHRNFIYTGNPVPAVDKKKHADFILNYQKSVLLALVKRNLLSKSQFERCVEIFEFQQNKH
jgi:hypothetical protein